MRRTWKVLPPTVVTSRRQKDGDMMVPGTSPSHSTIGSRVTVSWHKIHLSPEHHVVVSCQEPTEH